MTELTFQEHNKRDLVFILAKKEVARFTMIEGKLDIIVPADMPMTDAARGFIECVRRYLPTKTVGERDALQRQVR